MSETKKSLPVEDMYTLQVIEVQERKEQKQFNGDLKDEIVLICELVGTKNPDNEDEPYKVFIWGIRDVTKLVTSMKDGKVQSNAYIVLTAMGFDPDPNTSFKSIHWNALEGCFMRAFVGLSNDKQYLRVKPRSDIKPLTDKKLIEQNVSRKDEVFGGK